MVKLKLEYRAELEGITDLEPEPGTESFEMTIQCGSCREKHPNNVTVDPHEPQRQIAGSKGKANLVWRCGFCKREASATFDPGYRRQPYTADDAEAHTYAAVAMLECRGLDITDWTPIATTPWRCKGTASGTPFHIDEIDDWTDYDEKAGTGVSIMDLTARVSRG